MSVLREMATETRAYSERVRVSRTIQRARLGADLMEQFTEREIDWMQSIVDEVYAVASAEAYEHLYRELSSLSGSDSTTN